MDLPEGPEALVAANEMECKQAGGAFERPHWRGIDVTFVKADSRRMRSRDLFRHPEHVGRRVNAIKRPTGMILGESFQLQAATRSQDQNPSMRGDTLRQEHRRHAMKAREAGYLPGRALSVTPRMGCVEGGRIPAGYARRMIFVYHVTIIVTCRLLMSSPDPLAKQSGMRRINIGLHARLFSSMHSGSRHRLALILTLGLAGDFNERGFDAEARPVCNFPQGK